ncbi:MAG TPA: ATP-binding protein [Fontimonas sp.]
MTHGAPLRRRILTAALAGILPLVAAAGYLLLHTEEQRRAEAERHSLDTARLAGAAMDVEVEKSLAVLEGLAALPQLDDEDPSDLHEVLVRTLEQMTDWYAITLATPDRNAVVHVVEPEGEFITDGIETFSRVVATRQPVVGLLARDADGRWGLPLRVPVIRDGTLRYVLTAVLKPEAVHAVLISQHLPEDWFMSVFDAGGSRLARSHDHEATIGGMASPSLTRLMAGGAIEGSGVTQSIESIDMATAYRRLPVSGWTVAVGHPTETVAALTLQDARLLAIGLGGALLAALLASWIVGGGIGRPLRALKRAVEQTGRDEPPSFHPSGIAEIDVIGDALLLSAQGQRHTQAERLRTLQELAATQEGLRHQLNDLQRVHELSSELLQHDSLDGQLRAVLMSMCELHGSGRGLASLSGQGADGLQLRAVVGFPDTMSDRLAHVRAGKGACALALLSGRRVVISDTASDPAYAELREWCVDEQVRAVHSTPIRSSEGRILGVLTVYLDAPRVPTARERQLADLCAQLSAQFVERTLARREADRSEQTLHIALDSASVPFSILSPERDADGAVIDFTWDYLNLAAASMFERTTEEIAGRSLRMVASERWPGASVFESCVEVMASDQPRTWELETGAGNRLQWLHIVATPFSGRIAVWWSDITERKLQEQDLQEADRRKDEFIAILAHELRNPLAPIQQATKIARSPGSTEAQKSWSHDVIERQVGQMAVLLDDLLDVSRITRGHLALKCARVELASIVDSALETARPHIESRRHQLRIEVPQRPIHVEADPIRLAQAITNLLTNAARYTEPGGEIVLAVTADGNDAVIAVQDNGIGIPPEHLGKIFEMFSQVHSKRSTTDSGLGIGLALSRAVVTMHGGTLTAESLGSGHGSRFILKIPAVAAAKAPLTLVKPQRVRGRLRVLVSDDNRDAADTLASLLRLEGHDVLVAYDGEQAIAQFEQARPNVALIDIGMPRLNGYEVAQRIRLATAGDPQAPTLVALTGWGQEQDKQQARAAGFDHHLTKPVDPDLLLELLGRLRDGESPDLARLA